MAMTRHLTHFREDTQMTGPRTAPFKVKAQKQWVGLAMDITHQGVIPTEWDEAYLWARQKEADALYHAYQARIRQQGRRLHHVSIIATLFYGGLTVLSLMNGSL
jgi:hypothetical protein